MTTLSYCPTRPSLSSIISNEALAKVLIELAKQDKELGYCQPRPRAPGVEGMSLSFIKDKIILWYEDCSWCWMIVWIIMIFMSLLIWLSWFILFYLTMILLFMNCSDIPPVALIAVHTELNGIQEGGYHCSAGTSYWSPKLNPSRW